MLAVVLAAGSGRRLGRLTATRSKAMVPVAGKPMVERVMERLESEGVGSYVVVASPDDELLRECLRKPVWRDRVRTVVQQVPRGMADAVNCAVPLVRKDRASEFILISCDNILPEGHIGNLAALRRRRGWDAALTLLGASEQELSTMAAVVLDGERVTRIVEKPAPGVAPSNVGSVACYALTPRVLDEVPNVRLSPRGELEFPDALRLLIDSGGAVGGLITEERLTLTGSSDLLALTGYFLRNDPGCAIVETELLPDVIVIPPVRIEAGVSVGSACRIGSEVYLQSGCSVGNRAVVQRSVVLGGAEVAAGTDVRGLVVQASEYSL